MTAQWRGAVPFALAAAACATVAQRLDAPRSAAGIAIAPYALYEDCFVLSEGDRVEFQFSARQPTAFNVHYREGNAMVLPVELKSVTDESGDFVAEKDQTYCMSWEAGASGSIVAYRVRQVRPRS
ncbi:MAG: hypothetical protein ABI537_04465 [Casimicrobiaceae bacterium]